MTALLEVNGLTKRFGGLVAVKDIGFSINAGEILGLIGPNGSGKSTVMKCIMGIERPTAGQVKLSGIDVAGWPTHRIARQGVGIVFQHARPLHRQTILEHIKLALLPDNLLMLATDHGVTRRAEEIAARVGLSRVMHRLPRTLPFADLRRLELAKAIARNPKVVLVDEPFAGLTSGEVADFSELIAQFSQRRPRRPAGRPQRQKRRRPGRPRAGDVSRRERRRGHRRRGHAQRNRPPRLSRRQDRNRRPSGARRARTARRCWTCAISASSTARRPRWTTSRSMSARASSSPSSA